MTSLTQSAPQGRDASPLLSNNPFRTRAVSSNTPQSSANSGLPAQANDRPQSTNPFLDASEVAAPAPITTPAPGMADGRQSPIKPAFTDKTIELFDNLTVNDRPNRAAPPLLNGITGRPENVPPKVNARLPPPAHRPSFSEADRRRNMGKPRGPPGELNIFADTNDPQKHRERRPRRNSDTSIRERTNKPLDPEAEKRRRERREKDAKRYGKAKPASRRLDIIDKLDVTSIYGTGLFHHDGPFDACNPNRNRKGVRAAPMQAFPKDSSNMALGGSGPINSKLNLDQIHGTGHEAHVDYGNSAVADGYAESDRRPLNQGSESFIAVSRIEPLHGDESEGLGKTTFLEGAPASRAAIQRRQSENQAAMAAGDLGGLSRKKSLAQKIRAVRPGGRVVSPDGGPLERTFTPTSPPGTGRIESNVNPFFKDYDKDYDRKGAQIAFAATEKTGRVRTPSSPRRGLGLERKTTAESVGEESKTLGFLSRVKSLKDKGRRRREPSG